MTALYNRDDIRFMYPEGWRITEDNMTAEPRNVAIESPNGGTWEVIVYDGLHDREALTSEALTAMQSEYDDIETSPQTREFGSVEAVGLEMYFYHLDFLVSSRAFAAHFGDQTVLLLWQAEDRQFDELQPVFEAMATSLLNPDTLSKQQ